MSVDIKNPTTREVGALVQLGGASSGVKHTQASCDGLFCICPLGLRKTETSPFRGIPPSCVDWEGGVGHCDFSVTSYSVVPLPEWGT